ncbi:MAG: AI-2E family transporter [Firmicutes bacterium]|nr:AI-2E family transporter [Bacillota bacterium]
MELTRELKIFLVMTGAGVGLILGIKYLFPLIGPFLLGLLFACLIEPLVKRLEVFFKLKRRPAIAVVLASLLTVILGLTGLTILTLWRQAQWLLPKVPFLVRKTAEQVEGLLRYCSSHLPELKMGLKQLTLNTNAIQGIMQSGIGWVAGFLPQVPQLLFSIALGGVTAYFFSRDKEQVVQIILRTLPRNWQLSSLRLKNEIMGGVERFVRAEISLSVFTVIFTAVMLAILKIPGFLAYGVLAGFLDFIPLFGPGLFFVPLALVQLLLGNHAVAFFLMIGYFLLMLLRQIIEVRLIGEDLNLHPLLSMVIIYAGFKLFGFMGIFVGPVLMITLRALYRVLDKGLKL